MTGVWESSGGAARARERFLGGAADRGGGGRSGTDGGGGGGTGWGSGAVRGSILDSWHRCLRVGLLPHQADLPYRAELDLEDQLVRASEPVLERLHESLSGSRVSVLLADAAARILVRRAASPGQRQHLDAIQLAPGFSYAEDVAGTNGIGTSLAERRPFTVFSSEHFTDRLQSFACAGAPVRDPLSGSILGVLDLTCRQADAHPLMAALVRDAAADIGQRLYGQYTERERTLLRCFFGSAEMPGRPARPGRRGGGAGRRGPKRHRRGPLVQRT